MIVENQIFLRQRFPHILNLLNDHQRKSETSPFHLLETKSGDKTIEVIQDGIPHLLHSKYNPQSEAERLIDQFADDIENYEHVLFYGVGLGYHIKEFMNRFSNFTFSIYEPFPDIFNLYIKENDLTQLPCHKLRNIFIEVSSEDGKIFLEDLTLNIQERILLVVLPSYQQIFADKFKQFAEYFKAAVGTKRQAVYVDNQFSSRWTLNSLINFPKTIQTPNILDNEFKTRFKNKPVIIVSAGPSLEEDYENLRYIKKHKLAYIFAVGSANRALVAQNIMPDAVCTYDPQGHNHQVFASLIDRDIKTIPMIYGTSVGYETLNLYQGTKLHMITSQDTVAQFYLKNKDGSELDSVFDSPTIAAITFQLAAKLGCNPIIFAGQNLAFRNNQYYAKDVDYDEKNRPIEIREEEKQNVLIVDDVYGNKIETTPSLNNMRENIEIRINQFPNVEVINTTKGGAAIHGTVFIPLEELIKSRLTEAVVDEKWYLGVENQYDKGYALQQIKRMERSIDGFRGIYWQIQEILKDMNKNIEEKKENKLAKLAVKFDKSMKKLVTNECYITYIQPVNRNQFQALSIQAANIRKQTNEIDRAKLILTAFVPFLERCKQTLEKIAGSIYKMHLETNEEIKWDSSKFYPGDCGVFHYIGVWEKQNYSAGKTIDYYVKQMVAKGNSELNFRFTGTFLRVLGSKSRNGSNHIQIAIDGKIEKFSVKNTTNNSDETPKINEVLFEKHNLENKEHVAEIKVIDDNSFLFTGVEIDKDGRLYHVHEVTNVEDLEIGKRIRCHYKATYNKFGKFGGLGKETKCFIPPESSAYPDGDFYFIMVDEINGEKKLIADRNVQHSISKRTLKQNGIVNGKHIKFGKYVLKIKLLSGGKCYSTLEGEKSLFDKGFGVWPKDNDWDKYIVDKEIENCHIWNWKDITSLTQDQIESGFVRFFDNKSFIGDNFSAVRGKYTVDAISLIPIDSCTHNVGFRPMFEFR